MKTIISIETHVYAGERLKDEILDKELGDDVNSCGIIGPEIILPIRWNRNPSIIFEYTEKTAFRDAVERIHNEFGFLALDETLRPSIAFLYGGKRYWIDDINANFQKAVDKHLDPQKDGRIDAAVYVCGDAGCVCEEDGIRYFMNSRERGKHNEPHVHLRSLNSCEEAVIIIKTCEIVGKFPRKLKKKAIEKIRTNERFFLEQWNVLTDGLKVDINHYFELIGY